MEKEITLELADQLFKVVNQAGNRAPISDHKTLEALHLIYLSTEEQSRLINEKARQFAKKLGAAPRNQQLIIPDGSIDQFNEMMKPFREGSVKVRLPDYRDIQYLSLTLEEYMVLKRVYPELVKARPRPSGATVPLVQDPKP